MAIIQEITDFQEKHQNFSNLLRFLEKLKNKNNYKCFKTKKKTI